MKQPVPTGWDTGPGDHDTVEWSTRAGPNVEPVRERRLVIGNDFVLHVGDVLDVLAELRAESVDCVVTSPPYWGLRDYGTGEWEGGTDPFCDHDPRRRDRDGDSKQATSRGSSRDVLAGRETCRKCGAERVDRQIGLEPTPELYVERIVAVFEQVRRVLAPHGTVWLNLGDTYATSAGAVGERPGEGDHARAISVRTQPNRMPLAGFKPKDMVGVPWRVAFALQAAGWHLRADVIWSKPNPMPESVTDRPTKAHEYVFLLSKRRRYYYDAEAVAEPAASTELGFLAGRSRNGPGADPDRVSWHAPSIQARIDAGVDPRTANPSGTRNARSVWSIATAPYSDAHFATYPPELVRRCLRAGAPTLVCRVCGKPRERLVERTPATPAILPSEAAGAVRPRRAGFYDADAVTVGWSDCGHDSWRRGVVLDPFVGSGTTALVARELELNCVGVELNPVYAALTERRLQQLSLLAELPPAVVA